jgi:hypothetical protein
MKGAHRAAAVRLRSIMALAWLSRGVSIGLHLMVSSGDDPGLCRPSRLFATGFEVYVLDGGVICASGSGIQFSHADSYPGAPSCSFCGDRIAAHSQSTSGMRDLGGQVQLGRAGGAIFALRGLVSWAAACAARPSTTLPLLRTRPSLQRASPKQLRLCTVARPELWARPALPESQRQPRSFAWRAFGLDRGEGSCGGL